MNMSEFNTKNPDESAEKQNHAEPPQLRYSEQRRGLAIAALVLGILSVLCILTIILPFPLGILAIIFGVLSLKSQKKGMAVAGIITGGAGLLLSIVIIIVSVNVMSNPLNVLQSDIGRISPSRSNSEDSGKRVGTFYGNGFELKYSALWTEKEGTKDLSEAPINALILYDDTVFFVSGVSSMMGHTTATASKRQEIYDSFYDIIATRLSDSEINNGYLAGETETLVVLKDDIYYAAYSYYSEDDELFSMAFIIVSESDDIIVSFIVYMGYLTKYGPGVHIMPLLRSITFTGRASFADTYVQKVSNSHDEYQIDDVVIPSLSKIMDDNEILYVFSGEDKTIGKMVIPSILNFLDKEQNMASVEIIEIIYNDVSDAWGAIDTYGRMLNDTYDFFVTYPPYDYSAYGEGYRFCELIRDTGDDKNEVVYVSAVYSRDENIIKVQFGTIGEGFSLLNDGIGPINLEAVEREGKK